MFSRIAVPAIAAIVLACCVPANAAYERDLAELADSLRHLAPDPAATAGISNIKLVRGGISFTLESGTLALASPVAGRRLGAVFTGSAHVSFAPPNRAERYMFQRHCSDSVANWEVNEIGFVFTDSTIVELAAAVAAGTPATLTKGSGQLAGLIDYVEDDLDISFAAFLLTDLLQPARPGRFLARFPTPCGSGLIIVDPNEVEEVQFIRQSRTGEGAFPEVVSSFHLPEQYEGHRWGPDRENKDEIDSLDYRIDCKIWQSAKCDLIVDLAFTATVDSLRVLSFTLFDDLMQETIRVSDARGDSLYWLKLKDEYGITVVLQKPLQRGERETLRFEYSSKGMLAKTPWGNNVLVSATTWYPRYGYLKRARYRLKFAVPSQYEFVGVGRKVNETIAGDFKISEWDCSEYPVAFVSYNYGIFEIDTSSFVSTTGPIPLAVYRSKSHRASTKDMMESVLADVAASGTLYSLEVHPYPFASLAVTEIQSGHGQGLPGLLHLAYSTFDQTSLFAFDDAFRAHEVAHQWWGHLVGWKTYHDQWLSEAFAEYFSAWYIQRKYLNDKEHRGRFFDLLDQWRDDVFQSGSYTQGGWQTAYQEGNDAGPIWMGQRLQSSKSSDYATLVYSKGAYVLYMLRMMMFDFVKRDDSNFRALLGDFLKQYQWREATTADFQRVAEEHFGKPLDWFFDQWVYGVELPEYEWRAAVRKQPDGKFAVDVSVTTKGVSDGFRMLIPFTILMAGEYHTTTRLDISQLQQTVTVANLPYQPEKFVFNSFKSVLCKERQK